MEGEHFFELHTFGNFTHCHYCHKMLWGLRKQGYKCKYCGYAAHKKCLVDIARTAPACPRNPVIQRYFTAPSPVAAAASAPPPPPLYPSAAASYEVPAYVPPPPPMPSHPRSGGRGALLGDIQRGTRLRRVDRPPSPPPLLGLRPPERRSRVDRPPSPLVSPEMRSQRRRRSLSPSSSSHAVPVPPPMPPEPYSSRRRQQQQQRHTSVSGSDRGALLSAIRDRRNVQRLRRTPFEPDGFVRAGGSAHERRHSMTGGAGEQARLFPVAAAAEAADPPAWRNRSTSMSTLVQPPEFAAAAAAAAEDAEEIRRVLVNYDYQATTDVELTVQAGMELDVTAKQEGWIHVVDGPRSGWIPRSYTETIDPPRSGLRLAAAAAAPSAEPAASSEADPLRRRQNKKWGIATMSWIASESDELSVHSGAKLELLSEDDGGWIMCKTSDGQSGLLPSLCVNPRTEAEMAARALAVSMGRTIAADTRAPPLIAVSEPPAATTPVAAPSATPTPAQDPDDLCKICMDAKVDVVILWCGHVAICSSCARFLKKCPICRQAIFKIQKIYRA